MKILFLLPSLENKGPIRLALQIIAELVKQDCLIEVCYFKSYTENTLQFPCESKKIHLFKLEYLKKFDAIQAVGAIADVYLMLHKFRTKSKFYSSYQSLCFEDFSHQYSKLKTIILSYTWLASAYISKTTIIVPTEFAKKYYKRFLKWNKIKVIPNTPTNTMSLEKNNNITNQQLENLRAKKTKNNLKYIGCVGILSSRKNFETVIRALKLTSNTVHAIIIGNGEQEQALISLAHEIGVITRCHFINFQKNLTPWYCLFDLFIMPSLSEGMPLALLEAAKHNTPCICSDIEVHQEVFTKDEAIFFPAGNAEQLSLQINHGLDNSKYFAKAIYEKVSKNYTLDLIAQRYKQLYCNN